MYFIATIFLFFTLQADAMFMPFKCPENGLLIFGQEKEVNPLRAQLLRLKETFDLTCKSAMHANDTNIKEHHVLEVHTLWEELIGHYKTEVKKLEDKKTKKEAFNLYKQMYKSFIEKAATLDIKLSEDIASHYEGYIPAYKFKEEKFKIKANAIQGHIHRIVEKAEEIFNNAKTTTDGEMLKVNIKELQEQWVKFTTWSTEITKSLEGEVFHETFKHYKNAQSKFISYAEELKIDL